MTDLTRKEVEFIEDCAFDRTPQTEADRDLQRLARALLSAWDALEELRSFVAPHTLDKRGLSALQKARDALPKE
jgi:sulfur relay (sulfurtransferase) DsrF/TusC family protein